MPEERRRVATRACDVCRQRRTRVSFERRCCQVAAEVNVLSATPRHRYVPIVRSAARSAFTARRRKSVARVEGVRI